MGYRIGFAPAVQAHLQQLSARQRATLFDQVNRQLANEPLTETRNRKRMRPNALASWELRVGNLRVYYDIVEDKSEVLVLAVGIKTGNRVTIGGEAVEL